VEFCHARAGFDIYFLSNQEYFPVSAEVSFRITSRIPELWNPETGTIEEIAAWQEQNGRTIIPMNFDPSGAVFVVFRKASAGADPVVEVAGGKPVPSKGLRLRKTAAGLEAWVFRGGELHTEDEVGQDGSCEWGEHPGARRHHRRVERELPGEGTARLVRCSPDPGRTTPTKT